MNIDDNLSRSTTYTTRLRFDACLGGNGTLLGASPNIVTAGISTKMSTQFHHFANIDMFVFMFGLNFEMLTLDRWN